MGRANPKAKQPKVLIITAFRWFPMMRLALELSEAGFTVETLVPGGYGIEETPFVKTTYRYNAIAPIASLHAAIMASRPSLLVPYDDCVTTQLHQLYKLTDPSEPAGFRLRSLIARSLGQPEDLSMLCSRYRICSLARELKIPGPATEAVVDKSTLITQLNSLPLPVVLKSDGSWGGTGVVIATNREEAVRAFRKLSTPPGVLRALKRLIINRDPTLILPCLRRRRPAVSIQRFVRGRPANAAVACWEGKVLAAVLVEVLCSNGATGPATVVRVTSHPGMSLAIERMVDRLKLSGLCGFDFVLSAEDGSAQLIELNPRATPTCHLIAADGKDLLAALYAALQESRASNLRRIPRFEPLALFPQEMIRDPNSPFLQTAYHDIPRQSPELVKLGYALRPKSTGSLFRGVRWLVMECRRSWRALNCKECFGQTGPISDIQLLEKRPEQPVQDVFELEPVSKDGDQVLISSPRGPQ